MAGWIIHQIPIKNSFIPEWLSEIGHRFCGHRTVTWSQGHRPDDSNNTMILPMTLQAILRIIFPVFPIGVSTRPPNSMLFDVTSLPKFLLGCSHASLGSLILSQMSMRLLQSHRSF
ncbi:hypothetical protein HAX54_044797 [Datura stramonium]|uniref:Uncharacterized protein n=1 Tax=Datura stramonium TaxID=4076 RepID=A0ABS8WGV1_DATST|nr:hypothetical protein [Datura stramonium]